MIDRCAATGKMLTVCLCSFLLMACAPRVMQSFCPDVLSEDPERARGGETHTLLSYYDKISRSSPQALQTEHRHLLSRQTTEPGARDQLRLAVMLSRPDTPLRDDQHAQLLVEEYLESSFAGFSEDKAFAELFLEMLKERQRYGLSRGKLKAALEEERELRKELKKKSDQLEVEIVQLRAQLDQLKAIEEDVTESEQSIVAPLPENEPNGNETKSSSGR